MVKSPGSIAIAHILDDLADDVGNLDVGFGGDLARDEGDPGGQNRLAGHAAMSVLHDNGVQNSVGDLIRDFIRMAFGHRFGGKQLVISHLFLMIQWRSL